MSKGRKTRKNPWGNHRGRLCGPVKDQREEEKAGIGKIQESIRFSSGTCWHETIEGGKGLVMRCGRRTSILLENGDSMNGGAQS